MGIRPVGITAHRQNGPLNSGPWKLRPAEQRPFRTSWGRCLATVILKQCCGSWLWWPNVSAHYLSIPERAKLQLISCPSPPQEESSALYRGPISILGQILRSHHGTSENRGPNALESISEWPQYTSIHRGPMMGPRCFDLRTLIIRVPMMGPLCYDFRTSIIQGPMIGSLLTEVRRCDLGNSTEPNPLRS